MNNVYESSQIAFGLSIESQNKHREGLFSIHEPFEFSFSQNFELQNKY